MGNNTKTTNKITDNFKNELSSELIKSERLRMLISGWLFIILPIVLTVFISLSLLPITYDILVFICIWFGFSATFEFVLRFIMKKLDYKNKWKITIIKYISVFIETSFPTIMMILLLSLPKNLSNPQEVLQSPATFTFFIFITLSSLHLDFKSSLFSGVLTSLEYFLFALYISTLQDIILSVHIFKSILMLVNGVVTGIVTLEIKKRLYNSFRNMREKEKLKSIFGQHVSPEVVNKLINENEFTNENSNVCIMFLDIRGFTNFSTDKEAKEVFQYLNNLFDFMIEIINKNNGIINKFLGDGFMAIFGAPVSKGNDTQNAINASIEIVKEVQKRNRLGTIPKTNIGIGIHYGNAFTGNIGSSQRKEYTVIGDVVNVASRIESLNKEFGSQILISEEAWEDSDKIFKIIKDHGLVSIRGVENKKQIYQLGI